MSCLKSKLAAPRRMEWVITLDFASDGSGTGLSRLRLFAKRVVRCGKELVVVVTEFDVGVFKIDGFLCMRSS